MTFVDANGVVVGVLIDNRDNGIKFFKGSFIRRLCIDREISHVVSGSACVHFHSATS